MEQNSNIGKSNNKRCIILDSHTVLFKVEIDFEILQNGTLLLKRTVTLKINGSAGNYSLAADNEWNWYTTDLESGIFLKKLQIQEKAMQL